MFVCSIELFNDTKILDEFDLRILDHKGFSRYEFKESCEAAARSAEIGRKKAI